MIATTRYLALFALLGVISGCSNSSESAADAGAGGSALENVQHLVRILSHNIGPWNTSRDTALALFASEDFDIIALQEATTNTDAVSALAAAQPELSYSDDGTANPIFWRTSVFSWDENAANSNGVVEWSVPAEAMGTNRTANWVRLRHIASDRDILVMSTQLISLAGGLVNAAELNTEMIKSLSDNVAGLVVNDEAVLVVGDLNRDQASEAVQYLLGQGQLEGADSMFDLDDVEGNNKLGMPAIDYILVRADATVVPCSVTHTSTGSQHQAQTATLDLAGTGDSNGSCP